MPVFSQTIECILTINTKAVKKRAESLFELHQKWCLFLQLAAEKKTPFLVQFKQIFGPSYFDRALPYFEKVLNPKIKNTVWPGPT